MADFCTPITPSGGRLLHAAPHFQHRQGLTPGFASRYGCTRLVFYEHYARMHDAIAREKQIKGGSRAKKIALIESMNPAWSDLYDSLA